MKLALGTAQFGSDYGINNTNGKVSIDNVVRIVEYSRSVGINVIDTATSYGESEEHLGIVGVDDFNIITKLPSIPEYISDVDSWIINEVNASIKRLNVKNLYCLMLHRPNQLLEGRGEDIISSLKKLKKSKIIKKIGISIYSPEELKELFTIYNFDIVQTPFNIVDRRIVESGWLKHLKKLGVDVHVRSSFLQGLLLMPRTKIPHEFNNWRSLWDKWHLWLQKNSISPVDACLSYVASEPNVDKIIVGVDSIDQLQQIVSILKSPSPNFYPDIGINDNELLNPSNWKVK